MDSPSRTEMTLDSVATWIQHAQDRFDAATRAAAEAHERTAQTVDGAIDDFGRRLSKLEHRAVATPPSSIADAIKAIERIETRLVDTAPAHPETAVEDVLRGFEERIARLAGELGGPAHAIGRRPVRTDRDLAAAVAEIKTRQADLDADPSRPPAGRGTPPSARRSQADLAASLRGDIAGLAARMEDARAPEQSAIERLHGEIDTIRGSLAGLATRDQLAGLEHAVASITQELGRAAIRSPGIVSSSEIEGLQQSMRSLAASRHDVRIMEEIEQLSRKLDGLAGRDARPGTSAGHETAHVETLLGRLVERVEELERIDTAPALAQLERQVAGIADRLSAAPVADPAFARVERTMNGLLEEIAAWRERAGEIAERAARAAVAGARGGSAAETAALAQDLEAFRQRCDSVDQRVEERLASVGRTLAEVAARIQELGPGHPQDGPRRPADLASSIVGVQPAARDGARVEAAGFGRAGEAGTRADALADEALVEAALLRDADRPMPAAADEILLEPGAGRPVPHAGRDGETAIRSDFIAAARRAAKAAASEASSSRKGNRPAAPGAADGPDRKAAASKAAASKKPHSDAASAKTPASLGRLAALFGRHRKPVLIGATALVVVLGALQLGATLLGRPVVVAGAPVSAPAAPLPARSAGQPAAPSASAGAAPSTEQKGMPETRTVPDPITTQSITAAAAPAIVKPDFPILPSPPTAAASAPAPSQTASAAPEAAPPMPAGLKAAALTGNPVAAYEYASRLGDGRGIAKDPVLAAKFFEKAADKGLAPAQYRLGNIYEKGLGVARDLDAAKTWYRRAAERGNARAMHNLAVLLADGAGGAPSFELAATWFEKGAQQGVRDSQYNYAVLLARGLGVTQDLGSSYTWFAIAAGGGDTDAGRKRDEIGAKLSAADLAKAKAAVARWKPAAPVPGANDVQLPPSGFAETPKPATSPATYPVKVSAREGKS